LIRFGNADQIVMIGAHPRPSAVSTFIVLGFKVYRSEVLSAHGVRVAADFIRN